MDTINMLEILKGLLENIISDLETDNVNDNTIADIDSALELLEKEIGDDE